MINGLATMARQETSAAIAPPNSKGKINKLIHDIE
jgi:hypothetical protein